MPPKHKSVQIYPSQRQYILGDGSFLMYFQQLKLVPCFYVFLDSDKGFYRHFQCLGQKMSPNTYLAKSILPKNENTWEMIHFWCTSNDWTLCLISYVFFDIDEGFYRHRQFLGQLMSQKSHLWQYLPFLTMKAPGRWLIFDVLPTTELYVSFPVCFWTVM